MAQKETERRACVRFKVPGAIVSYKIKKLFPSKKKFDEEFCPVLDISRGGLKFEGEKSLKSKTKISMKLSLPGERVSLNLMGEVRWQSFDQEKNKHQAGIQFFPYGEKKGQNYPGALVKIIALEQKFAPSQKTESSKTPKDEFKMES